MLNGEVRTTNFIVFGLTRPGSNPRPTSLEASMLTITPPMWYIKKDIYLEVMKNRRTTNTCLKNKKDKGKQLEMIFNVTDGTSMIYLYKWKQITCSQVCTDNM